MVGASGLAPAETDPERAGGDEAEDQPAHLEADVAVEGAPDGDELFVEPFLGAFELLLEAAARVVAGAAGGLRAHWFAAGAVAGASGCRGGRSLGDRPSAMVVEEEDWGDQDDGAEDHHDRVGACGDGRDLARRYEAEDEGEGDREEAGTAEQPDAGVAARDPVGAVAVGVGVAEPDHRDEDQRVHDAEHLGGERAQDPVGAVDPGDEQEGGAERGGEDCLEDDHRDGDAASVLAAPDLGEEAIAGRALHPFGGADHPGRDKRDRADEEEDRGRAGEPGDVELSVEVGEGLDEPETRLIFSCGTTRAIASVGSTVAVRDDRGRDPHRAREVAAGFPRFARVEAGHLHPGEHQDHGRDENHRREVPRRRGRSLRRRFWIGAALACPEMIQPAPSPTSTTAGISVPAITPKLLIASSSARRSSWPA